VRGERCKAATFSREAVTFFCKAVTFSREAVTFYLSPLTSHLPPLTSPLSLLIMDSLTGKHLTHVAHVAPNCGWGRNPMRSGPPLSPPSLAAGRRSPLPLREGEKPGEIL